MPSQDGLLHRLDFMEGTLCKLLNRMRSRKTESTTYKDQMALWETAIVELVGDVKARLRNQESLIGRQRTKAAAEVSGKDAIIRNLRGDLELQKVEMERLAKANGADAAKVAEQHKARAEEQQKTIDFLQKQNATLSRRVVDLERRQDEPDEGTEITPPSITEQTRTAPSTNEAKAIQAALEALEAEEKAVADARLDQAVLLAGSVEFQAAVSARKALPELSEANLDKISEALAKLEQLAHNKRKLLVEMLRKEKRLNDSINRLTQDVRELDQLRKSEEARKVEIEALETEIDEFRERLQIKDNKFASLKKERDALRSQLAVLTIRLRTGKPAQRDNAVQTVASMGRRDAATESMPQATICDTAAQTIPVAAACDVATETTLAAAASDAAVQTAVTTCEQHDTTMTGITIQTNVQKVDTEPPRTNVEAQDTDLQAMQLEMDEKDQEIKFLWRKVTALTAKLDGSVVVDNKRPRLD